MKVGATKIAPTFSNSAFCLTLASQEKKSELLEVGVLQYTCLRGVQYCSNFSASNLVSSHYLSYWKLMSKPDPYTSSLSYMSKHQYRRYSRV